MAKQFVVNPSRCKKFLPGHGTHWGPVLKTHPNTPRVRVLVYDLDEEGWNGDRHWNPHPRADYHCPVTVVPLQAHRAVLGALLVRP